MPRLCFLGVLLCLTLPVVSQSDFVKGEVLVKVDHQNSIALLEDEFKAYRLMRKRLLVPSMQIWQLTFSPTAISEIEMVDLLYQKRTVEEAQVNHILSNRSRTPNDPRFIGQWQYLNDGSLAGSTIGADIDADLAWDYTTGGLTANGDTIVVCIIDDGFQIDHEDLVDNFWINHSEIAGDSIDNDNNGYIDDVRGWNMRDNSNDVNAGIFDTHGTPIAGIIGAKGNNGIGLTGVNWDVKLMTVVGGGEEADALAAYNYPYIMRKKYNTSNGAEGAFVVATNSSWGINFGLAIDSPLWCSFYDSLGSVGILNAGATTNLNVNVDVDGDLPTQCSSDYLIAVTNTDFTDNKPNNAGYGVNSVDLSAPGNGVYTVKMTTGTLDEYAAFNGTSSATPHVAGAIALLYSLPHSAFMDSVNTNPARAAELVKAYIMDGVDTLTVLNNITVSGGRLNLHKSVMIMNDEFVSVENPKALTSIYKFYPNPAENAVIVKFVLEEDVKIELVITNMLGQEIKRFGTDRYLAGKYHQILDIQDIPSGMYLLSIQEENSVSKSLKLVINK